MFPSWARIFGDNRDIVVGLLQRFLCIFLSVCLLTGSVLPAQTASTKTPAKKTTPQRRAAVATKARKRTSPRLHRMHQAFAASADLRPMARQLLQDRTPAAYAGVEAYARK